MRLTKLIHDPFESFDDKPDDAEDDLLSVGEEEGRQAARDALEALGEAADDDEPSEQEAADAAC